MNLVLCYHHVSPWRQLCSTAPAVFDAHLASLRRAGYALVGLDEFAQDMHAGPRARARVALVSFDDGHADNWLHAAPVLAAHDAPAVMFAISADVADGPVRHDGDAGLPPGATEDDPVRIRWSELRHWSQAGRLSVESHTHRHRNWGLADEPAPARLRALAADLAESRSTIARRLGRPPQALAWPWGYSDPPMREVARDAGFDWQFSVVPGVNGAPGEPGRVAHRIVADGLSATDFDAMLARYRNPVLARARSRARMWLSESRGRARRGFASAATR